jgi:hypothetical protein
LSRSVAAALNRNNSLWNENPKICAVDIRACAFRNSSGRVNLILVDGWVEGREPALSVALNPTKPVSEFWF